ncbi:protein of unknown function [Petrocella atlantisensis]|uniref:Uncharacterized protein n=1 Tax=Petrocella atlantisensis TaxID=2173034 RepID=A0A3P7NSQ4_9FIRM|nr:protein of unknown function [Petrocella atlantisensis]
MDDGYMVLKVMRKQFDCLDRKLDRLYTYKRRKLFIIRSYL